MYAINYLFAANKYAICITETSGVATNIFVSSTSVLVFTANDYAFCVAWNTNSPLSWQNIIFICHQLGTG